MSNNLITTKQTVNPVYTAAQNAQATITTFLVLSRDMVQLQKDCYDFEDTMNGLSGALQGIDQGLLTQVRADNSTIVSHGTSRGVSIQLHKSVLPKASGTSGYSQALVTGKKLYPLTTTTTTVTTTGVDSAANVSTSAVQYDPNTAYSYTATEEVDPLFAAIDANATMDLSPLAFEQNETVPILPEGMIVLAEEAAANANGLQAGLTVFSYNPLATIIDDTQQLLLYYTESNYANLNVALSTISADPLLAVEYRALKEAIAGGDGLSGGVAQMSIFRDHTDRLAGLVLAEDSPNAEATGDSTDEFLNVNDISGNLQPIFSFDARKFRSARYTVQGSAANTDRGHQVTELYILHDNELAYTREIVSVYTQDPFITFTTQFLAGNVRVLANTAADNTDFVIHGTKLRIARVAESFADMSQQKIILNHETCQAFLNDGIDRVALCSSSLLHPAAVAELAREFRDMLIILGEITGTTVVKQIAILQWRDTFVAKRAAIQALIDADYANFAATRKLVEALQIAENITISYTDSTGNTIPKTTLNTPTITAIEAALADGTV